MHKAYDERRTFRLSDNKLQWIKIKMECGLRACLTAASGLLWNGLFTKAYFPAVNRLQLRHLQCLITAYNILFHKSEAFDRSTVRCLLHQGPGHHVANPRPEGC